MCHQAGVLSATMAGGAVTREDQGKKQGCAPRAMNAKAPHLSKCPRLTPPWDSPLAGNSELWDPLEKGIGATDQRPSPHLNWTYPIQVLSPRPRDHVQLQALSTTRIGQV